MRKKIWFSLSSLVVISVLIVALVSGLALAAETDTAETPSSEAQVLDEGINECPALNGECPYSGEQYRENNRYGMSPDAKGEGVGQQIRQQVQARDESCIADPEAAQARREARDARQGSRSRGRMARQARINTPDA